MIKISFNYGWEYCLPGWDGNRRNIHLFQPIMIINHPLSVCS